MQCVSVSGHSSTHSLQKIGVFRGEVAVGSPMIGVNHRATKNQKDTIRAVSPVRPPLLIPVADSARHPARISGNAR